MKHISRPWPILLPKKIKANIIFNVICIKFKTKLDPRINNKHAMPIMNPD